jgi:YHS domain-containing protein
MSGSGPVRRAEPDVRLVTAATVTGCERASGRNNEAMMNEIKDPVCGRTVERMEIALTHGDETVYFCSETCRRKFEAEPERFAPERHEPPYTVRGGVAAPKFGAAGSGGLEYEATPERHDEEPRRGKR